MIGLVNAASDLALFLAVVGVFLSFFRSANGASPTLCLVAAYANLLVSFAWCGIFIGVTHGTLLAFLLLLSGPLYLLIGLVAAGNGGGAGAVAMLLAPIGVAAVCFWRLYKVSEQAGI